MIPQDVVAAALAAPVAKLPPSVQAINFELSAGAPTLIAANTMADYFASGESDEATRQAFGGHPGLWWVASITPSLPQRSQRVDDWAARMIAQAPAEVRAAVLPGTLQPKILRTWDDVRQQLDVEHRATVQAILESVVGDALRRAGLDVMASVKDVKVKEELRHESLEDVCAFAALREVRPNRTVLAASGVDVAAIVRRALLDVGRKITAALTQADASVQAAILDVFAAKVKLSKGSRIKLAAAHAERAVDEILVRRLADPNDPAPELGEVASGRVGGRVALEVIAMASGAQEPAAGQRDPSNGLFVSSEGKAFAGTLTTRPEILRGIMAARVRPQVVAAVAEDVEEANIAFDTGAVLAQVTVWHHGRPDRPFKPHQALDGKIVGSAEFEELATASLSREKADGSVTETPPFNLGRWFPGDHDGCTCSWSTETVIEYGIDENDAGAVTAPVGLGPTQNRPEAPAGPPSLVPEGATAYHPAEMVDSDGNLMPTGGDYVQGTPEEIWTTLRLGGNPLFDKNVPSDFTTTEAYFIRTTGGQTILVDLASDFEDPGIGQAYVPPGDNAEEMANWVKTELEFYKKEHPWVEEPGAVIYRPRDGQRGVTVQGNSITVAETMVPTYLFDGVGVLTARKFDFDDDLDATALDFFNYVQKVESAPSVLDRDDFYFDSDYALHHANLDPTSTAPLGGSQTDPQNVMAQHVSLILAEDYHETLFEKNSNSATSGTGQDFSETLTHSNWWPGVEEWLIDPVPTSDPNLSSYTGPPITINRDRNGIERTDYDWIEALSPAAREQITSYTGADYTRLNGYLRDGQSVDDIGYRDMQDAILTYVRDEVQTLRRTVDPTPGGRTEATVQSLAPGDTYSEAGFGSFSNVDENGLSAGFANSALSGSTSGQKVQIVVQTNLGANVDEISSNSGEKEVILPAGTDYTVVSVEEVPNFELRGYGSDETLVKVITVRIQNLGR